MNTSNTYCRFQYCCWGGWLVKGIARARTQGLLTFYLQCCILLRIQLTVYVYTLLLINSNVLFGVEKNLFSTYQLAELYVCNGDWLATIVFGSFWLVILEIVWLNLSRCSGQWRREKYNKGTINFKNCQNMQSSSL